MDAKGSGPTGQGANGDSGREGQGALTYARRGPEARSEYPGRRGDGSVGSPRGSDFANQGTGSGGP